MLVERHKAAIRRRELSRPVRIALDDGLISEGRSVLDYGCGHGDDVRLLAERGINASGWDPVHRPGAAMNASDVVNLGYVVNVIEDVAERAGVVRAAWTLATRVLVVSARTRHDERCVRADAFGDGVVTRLGTFQKFFEHAELGAWLEAVLGVAPLAAAPGIFYVFRDQGDRELLAASRVRRQPAPLSVASAAELFARHATLLQPLVDFVSTRGRAPSEAELPSAGEIRETVGSLARAARIVRAAVGADAWEAAELARSEDLLIYLALARFQRRPILGQLPRVLQLDIRAMFRTYQRACTLADEVLAHVGSADLIDQGCRSSSVGKLTPAALYVHASAVSSLPALLRVYEGCARGYLGSVDGANIVKLHRRTPAISYLVYPSFDNDPHPTLTASLMVHLQTLEIDYRDYSGSRNPPVLHRKDCFLAPDHPARGRFRRLTEQEEAAGLFEQTEAIGTKEGWAGTLARHGYRLRGHHLVRALVTT